MSASVMILVGLLLAVAGVWSVRLVLAFVTGLLAARVLFFVVGQRRVARSRSADAT